jgi:succinoglycan biosynthesis transport protein ExoP
MDHENDVDNPISNTGDISKSRLTMKNPNVFDKSQKKSGRYVIEKYQDWISGLRGNGHQPAQKAAIPGDSLPENEKSTGSNGSKDKFIVKNSGSLEQSQGMVGSKSIGKYQDWIHGLRGKSQQPEIPETSDNGSKNDLMVKNNGSRGDSQNATGRESIEIYNDPNQELPVKPQQPAEEATILKEDTSRVEKSSTTADYVNDSQSSVEDFVNLDQLQDRSDKELIERDQNPTQELHETSQQPSKLITISEENTPEIAELLPTTDNVNESQSSVDDPVSLNQPQHTSGKDLIEIDQDLIQELHEKPQQTFEESMASNEEILAIETSSIDANNINESQSSVVAPVSLDQPQDTSGTDLIEIDQELIQEIHENTQQPSEEVSVSVEGSPQIEKSLKTTDNVSESQLVVNAPGRLDQPQNADSKETIERNQDLIQGLHEKSQLHTADAAGSSERIPGTEKTSTTINKASKSQLSVKNSDSLNQSQNIVDGHTIEKNQVLTQELHEKPQQLAAEVTVSGDGIHRIEKSTTINHKEGSADATSGIGRIQQPGMNIVVKDERHRAQSGDIPPLELKRYINLIRKRRLLFASVAAAIIIGAFIISHIIPPLYEAKTLVSIEKNFLNDISKGLAVSPSVDSKVSALSTILGSRTLIYKVISDLDLDVTKKSDAEIEKLIKKIQDRMEVKIEFNRASRNDVDYFIVSFKDGNPKIARDYVNTLIGRYIEESLKYKREESTGANSFLLEQINFFKEKVGKLDAEIVKLRAKEAQAELMRKKEEEAELMKNNRIIAGDERLIELKKLQRRLDYLVVHYTDTFPEVVKTKADIEALKEKIKAHPYKPPIDDGAVKQSTETTKATLTLDSDVKTRLAELERERETNQRIYDELASAYGISQVSTQAEIQDRVGRFRIVDPAILPFKPVSPDRLKILLIGIFAGLAGAFGLIMFLDSFNKSVKNVDSLKKFGLPVIIVPHVPNPDELKKTKRSNIFFYGFSSLFVCLLIAVLVREVLEKLQ